MDNCDKIEYTCGKKINSRCTDYEGTVNDNSDLTGVKCLNIHQTTVDIYKQLDDIYSGINLTGLGKKCITFTPVVTGKLKVNEALLTFEDELCNLKKLVPDPTAAGYCPPVFEEDFLCLGLDMKCLVDPCGAPIKNLKTLLQALIDKTCECCP